jgi:hypothetical protein
MSLSEATADDALTKLAQKARRNAREKRFYGR